MQRLLALLSSNICTVLMLLLLIVLSLPAAFAQPTPVPQPINMHSQHEPSTYVTIDCEADCAGTVHHCCLYALITQQPLTFFFNPTQHSQAYCPIFSVPETLLRSHSSQGSFELINYLLI